MPLGIESLFSILKDIPLWPTLNNLLLLLYLDRDPSILGLGPL
jgi:hypothetical protein